MGTSPHSGTQGISRDPGNQEILVSALPLPSSPACSTVKNSIHPPSIVPSRRSTAPEAPLSVPVHKVLRKSHTKMTAPQPRKAGYGPTPQDSPRATGAIAAVWARPARASPTWYREGRGRGAHQG